MLCAYDVTMSLVNFKLCKAEKFLSYMIIKCKTSDGRIINKVDKLTSFLPVEYSIGCFNENTI